MARRRADNLQVKSILCSTFTRNLIQSIYNNDNESQTMGKVVLYAVETIPGKQCNSKALQTELGVILTGSLAAHK